VIYLDTGVLVRALLQAHPSHAECFRLVNNYAVSSCHSLAEAFNTLTGAFKIRNDTASEMVQSLLNQINFEAIALRDYLLVIGEARQRGIQGGIIYDALHAGIARRLKVEKLITYNLTNFRHVAPDLEVSAPSSES
jgi:predicted nucleic acid-binding protein